VPLRPTVQVATSVDPSRDAEVRRTGIVDCCARVASGHAAAPPANVMNLRRRPWSNIGLAHRLSVAGRFVAWSGEQATAERPKSPWADLNCSEAACQAALCVINENPWIGSSF
jgi:hypothetical protein